MQPIAKRGSKDSRVCVLSCRFQTMKAGRSANVKSVMILNAL